MQERAASSAVLSAPAVTAADTAAAASADDVRTSVATSTASANRRRPCAVCAVVHSSPTRTGEGCLRRHRPGTESGSISGRLQTASGVAPTWNRKSESGTRSLQVSVQVLVLRQEQVSWFPSKKKRRKGVGSRMPNNHVWSRSGSQKHCPQGRLRSRIVSQRDPGRARERKSEGVRGGEGRGRDGG